MMNKYTFVKAIIIPFFLFVCFQKTEAQTVNLQDFAAGFNWLVGFEHAPGDERLYAFTKDGTIRIVNTNGIIINTFLNISSKVNNSWNNEQGLVGLAFHPDYQSNGYFYVFYNQTGTGVCTIARYSRLPNSPDYANVNSEQILLTFDHPNPNHVGGCLKFGPDGYLYIAAGDGGGAGDPSHNGQNLQTYLGKILRIDVDGGTPYTIPSDNPFLGDPAALPEIWAYGLRNPWRFSFDRLTGDLWVADVGQDEREEVNFQSVNSQGGKNFGWSCMEGTMTFNQDQCDPDAVYTPPLYEYNHDGQECSITGGVVYRGGAYADLFGKYLFTDFCAGKIWSLSKNGAVVEVVEMGNFNDNDFTVLDEDVNGELYLAGFFSNKILKIRSVNCTPVALIEGPATQQLAPGGSLELSAVPGVPTMDYQWTKDGNPVPGQDAAVATITEPGTYAVVVTNPVNNCLATSNAVQVLAAGALAIAGREEVCEHTPVEYSVPAVPGANYLWTFSGISEVEGLGTNKVTVEWGDFQNTGTLNLTVISPTGDQQTASLVVAIQQNDLALATAVTPVTCAGGQDGSIALNVSGLSGVYTYHWSNGASTQNLSNLPAGNYSVTVTGDYGCTATTSAMVNALPSLTVSTVLVHPTPGQSDGSIELAVTGGTPPYIFTWDNGLSGNPVSGLPAGDYAVTVTDGQGCEVPVSVHLEAVSRVGEKLPLEDLRVFPNPATEEVTVSFKLPRAMGLGLEVYDMLGRRIATVLPWAGRGAGDYSEKIRVEGWPSGPYFLLARMEDEPFSVKIAFFKMGK